MRVVFGILFFLAGCARGAALADDTKSADGLLVEGFVSRGVFEYDVTDNDSRIVKGQPRANRVHVRFVPELNDWVFVVTDLFGRFPKPLEVLVSGSVLSGDMLGTSFNRRYKFMPGPRWIATRDQRKLRLLVLDDPPRFKQVTFESFGTRRLEFVNPKREPNLRPFISQCFGDLR